MNIDERITHDMDAVIAKIFRKDESYIAANHQLRLKEDLQANSKHYFPIISCLEENYDLMIDYHQFQYYATTIQTAIDYALAEYHKQKA